MSDLFEAGLRIDEGASVSAGDVVGGDGADHPAFDAVEAERTNAQHEERYAAGDVGASAALLDQVIEEHAEDQLLMKTLSAWLFQDQRAILDDRMYRSAERCAEALGMASGSFLTVEAKASLRSLRRKNARRKEELDRDAQELSRNSRCADERKEELGKEIAEAQSEIEKLRAKKDAMELSMRNASHERTVDFGQSAQAGAFAGAILLGAYVVVSFNWDQYAALLYFILMVPFGAAIGAAGGAVVGCVLGAIVSHMRLEKRRRAEASGKAAVERAEEALAKAVGEKERLEKEAQDNEVHARELESGDEIGEKLALVESHRRKIEALMRKLEKTDTAPMNGERR